MNRKRLIIGAAILGILLLAGVGFLLSRLKPDPPQARQRRLVAELAYCSSNNVKPCIVSFSRDGDGNMLVNMITPASSYPDFYLTIRADDLVNRYDCQKADDFPTNVYCTGREIYPGRAVGFAIVSLEDDSVLAEGSFAIIGLLLETPGGEVTATLEQTESSTPSLLEIRTPTPRASRTPSYPNPSSYP